MMHGCRICGGLTARPRRLCGACGAHLDDYETLDSRTADLLIPVRRYGCAPAAAAPGTQPPARQAPRRLLLALACAGLAAALALGLLAAS